MFLYLNDMKTNNKITVRRDKTWEKFIKKKWNLRRASSNVE